MSMPESVIPTSTWAIETGNPDVIVGITDSGMDMAHPDLQRNRWRNLGEINCPLNNEAACCSNGVDDDDNGYVDDCYGYNFGDNVGGADLMGSGSHGTHVAGIVAADSNNGEGVAGTAGGDVGKPGASLMTLTCFGQTGTQGFADSIVYAADNGASISQNSWGYTSPGAVERPVLDAIDYFNMNGGGTMMDGGLVIVAAGNDNSDDAYYPGYYSGAVAVASLNRDSAVASGFTNYGDWIDISAPGSDIRSTAAVADGGYALLSGTSMACPYVSGVLALLISRRPNLGRQDYLNCMEETATNIDSSNTNNNRAGQLGAGVINPFKLLTECFAPPPSPPAPPAPPPSPPAPPAPPPLPLSPPPPPPPPPGPEAPVTVTVLTDRYPGETSWVILRASDNQIMAERDSFTGSEVTHVDTPYLAYDVYRFEIRDSFGDGLCCGYGAGSVTLSVGGVTEYEASSFGARSTHTFTLSADPPTAPSPSPSPSPPASSIPRNGVAILDGGSTTGAVVTCLFPGDDDVNKLDNFHSRPHRQLIAVQCCDQDKESDSSGCRRFIGANNDNGCLSGKSMASDPIDEYTFGDAVAMCQDRGLVLCKQTCRNKGCNYNSNPVYTNMTCPWPAPAPSPSSPSPSSPSPAPPSPYS